jgi:anti-anti-sigma factor
VSSPVPFTVDVDAVDDGQRVLVVPRGELDIATVGIVRDAIAGVTSRGSAEIVLDLRDLTFMDSTGVRLLIEQDDASRKAPRIFFIVEDNPTVTRVLEMSGVIERLPIVRADQLAGPRGACERSLQTDPSAPGEGLDRGVLSS